MKKTACKVIAAALCLLLLAGCAPAGENETPEPSEPLMGEAQETFFVDTGGTMGKLMVNAAWSNGCWNLSVWDQTQADQPIQTMTAEGSKEERRSTVEDFNFDGYTDFGYAAFLGNYSHVRYTFWLWDEAQGQFVESPECSALCNPQFDAATETVSSYLHQDVGACTKNFYRWENGELAAVRQIEVGYQMVETEDGQQVVAALAEDPEGATQTLIVTDWAGGEPQEVCRRVFETGSDAVYDEARRWYDLDYHGE